jgi:hypothetical protein
MDSRWIIAACALIVWTGLLLVTFLGMRKKSRRIGWLEFAQVSVVTFVVVVVLQVLLDAR